MASQLIARHDQRCAYCRGLIWYGDIMHDVGPGMLKDGRYVCSERCVAKTAEGRSVVKAISPALKKLFGK